MVSPVVRVRGGSKAAKKGRKARNSVYPAPVLPSRVEAATESCQLCVMLSETLEACNGVAIICGDDFR